MSDHFNPTPAVFHKRRDGSMFMSFGNPIHGFHNQFDFDGFEKLGEHIATAVNAYGPLREYYEAREALYSVGTLNASEEQLQRVFNARAAVKEITQ